MGCDEKNVVQLARILGKNKYPNNKDFHYELKKILDKKTGDSRLSEICLLLLK